MRKYPKKLDFNTEDYEELKVSELKRLCDYWFRQYLLSKAARKGTSIYCPIKKRYYSESKIQVCHFIDRATMCLRYDETNCNLLSAQSNMYDSSTPKEGYKSLHHYDYEMWLGEKKVEYLLDKSKDICIFARQDYVNLICKFKNGR